MNKDEKDQENLRKVSPARPPRAARPKTAPAHSKKVETIFIDVSSLQQQEIILHDMLLQRNDELF
jgi:hypothetical protein